MKTKFSLKRIARLFLIVFLVLFTGPVVSLVSMSNQVDAESSPGTQNQALLDPVIQSEAIIQVYAARTWGLKGALAVHTWISTKRNNADVYRNYQVIGWRHMHGKRTPLAIHETRLPQQEWFGNASTLLLELRGEQYESTIDSIESVIAGYPYLDTYTMWPGPNSNTFVAYVARLVPEMGLDLPSTAIGKDYRPWNYPVGRSPSRTGFQASLFGLAGFTLAVEEGLELNLLSLNFELDIFDLAIELPGIGRIGPDASK